MLAGSVYDIDAIMIYTHFTTIEYNSTKLDLDNIILS